MIIANQLKKGQTILLDGQLYTVVETQHVKPGKGGAFISSKIKKLSDGTIMNKTLRSQEKVEIAFIEERKLQYLYNKSGMYYFMDLETYEQKPISKDSIENLKPFLKENIEIMGSFYNSNLVNLTLPNFINMKITDTQPGVKGDTASGGTKPAILETGLEIQVPLFINNGDFVKVDSRTSEYVERV